MAAQKKKFCLRGHLRDDEHTFIDSKGWAQCRECAGLRQISYRKRQREKGLKLTKEGWRRDPARDNLLAPALEEVLHGNVRTRKINPKRATSRGEEIYGRDELR